MKNFGLKAFSLLVAAMLAYFVHSDTNEGIIGISVPVELNGLPADKVIIYPPLRQAQVSIKGPSFLMSQIYSSPPSFKVKVPANVGNRFVAVLNKDDLAFPPSVEVIRVEPAEIEFTFDTLVRKEVPVQVTQIGTPPDGVKLSEIAVKPAKVTVSGPQTEVAKLKRVETEPIDLREVRSEAERELALRFNLKQSELSTQSVAVKISVTTVQGDKKFDGLPIEVRSTAADTLVVSPEKVTVKVSGPKDRINALKKEEVIPYVRIGKDEKAGEYPILFELPKGVDMTSAEPEKVKVVRKTTAKK